MNTVIEVGNLTRDPELRFTPGGQAVCKFSIAVNRSYTDKGGEKVEETSFFNCTAWRSLAENVAESLHTGTRVIVHGRLVSRSWETDEGQKRTAIEIEAYNVGPDLGFATAEVTKNQKKGE